MHCSELEIAKKSLFYTNPTLSVKMFYLVDYLLINQYDVRCLVLQNHSGYGITQNCIRLRPTWRYDNVINLSARLYLITHEEGQMAVWGRLASSYSSYSQTENTWRKVAVQVSTQGHQQKGFCHIHPERFRFFTQVVVAAQ